MKSKNIREVTKKEKYRGLTLTSWKIAGFGSVSFFPYLNVFAFLLFTFLLALFYITEYFDDDFIEIFITKIGRGIKNEYFA